MGKGVTWEEWNPTKPDEKLATKPGLYALVLVKPNALGSRVAYIGSAGGKAGAKTKRTLKQRLQIRGANRKHYDLPWLNHHVFYETVELAAKGAKVWLHHPAVEWSHYRRKPRNRRENDGCEGEGRIFVLAFSPNNAAEIGLAEKWLLWFHYEKFKHFPRLNRKCPSFRKPEGRAPKAIFDELCKLLRNKRDHASTEVPRS